VLGLTINTPQFSFPQSSPFRNIAAVDGVLVKKVQIEWFLHIIRRSWCKGTSWNITKFI